MWQGPYGDWGSRKYLISSLDQSLRRMHVDYVDVFYHHRPDPDTPLEETMGALAQIVSSGKALYVGLSNYNGERLKTASALLREMKVPFVINQNRYNIFDWTIEENGLLEASIEEKKGIICFSPLAQGLLTDRYLKGIPEDSRISRDGRFLNEKSLSGDMLAKIKALNDFAADRGDSLSRMALRWLLDREGITSVIIGASKSGQILTNLEVLDSKPLSEDELRKIDELAGM